MKNNKIKKFILVDILLLVLLFLASSTDLLIKEKEIEVYKIAVMVDMPVKGQADNFRAGIMKASVEYHTDMNFINLASWNEIEDKKAVLQKELENGCKGVILHCVQEEAEEAILEMVPAGIPVVLYAGEAEAVCVRGSVGSDPAEECKILLEAILQDGHNTEGIVLVELADCAERVQSLHDQIQEQLETEGLLVRRIQVDSLSEVQTLVRGVSALLGGTFVSGDISVLQALGEGSAVAQNEVSVYGIGFHNGIRRLLEEGHISGTVVHRAYEAGYFSVKKMVDILSGEVSSEKSVFVEAALVTQKNMYTSAIESMIFPYV